MELKGRRVLFISYNGMLDPLGQSQVIPYLCELSGQGVRFTLLSFERDRAWQPEGIAKCERLKESLAAHNIDWHRLRYHQRPSLPATVYDVRAGVAYARRLVERDAIEMVHARSHIPAVIALSLKKKFGLKMIFDVRGLMAEEYVDAGHWRRGSFKYHLTKRMERRCLAAADGVVTLTKAIWPIIREWDGLRGRPIVHEVVPCCADLERFRFDGEERVARRSELNLHDRFVLVYSGSVGGWYLTEEMADFFGVLLKERPEAHFLWLVPSAHGVIKDIMQRRGIAPDKYTVLSAASAEVPSYLSASDAGIAFIKPCFSKLASSPTKTAEYLACGLPLIINKGVGDSDVLVTEERAGALINDFTDESYRQGAATITRLLEDVEGMRRHARSVAEKLFDLHRVGLGNYARLYQEILGRAV